MWCRGIIIIPALRRQGKRLALNFKTRISFPPFSLSLKFFLEAQPKEWSRWVLTAIQGSCKHSHEWIWKRNGQDSVCENIFRCPNWTESGQNPHWRSGEQEAEGPSQWSMTTVSTADTADAGRWKHTQRSSSWGRRWREKASLVSTDSHSHKRTLYKLHHDFQEQLLKANRRMTSNSNSI